MGIISWIIIGGVAGWLASIVIGNNQRQGCIMNIVVGIVGAFIGGFVMRFVGGGPTDFGFDIYSLLVATVGAIILLAVTGAGRRRR